MSKWYVEQQKITFLIETELKRRVKLKNLFFAQKSHNNLFQIAQKALNRLTLQKLSKYIFCIQQRFTHSIAISNRNGEGWAFEASLFRILSRDHHSWSSTCGGPIKDKDQQVLTHGQSLFSPHVLTLHLKQSSNVKSLMMLVS